jgi:hypothetical protein
MAKVKATTHKDVFVYIINFTPFSHNFVFHLATVVSWKIMNNDADKKNYRFESTTKSIEA